jgi:hypothetical protein
MKLFKNTSVKVSYTTHNTINRPVSTYNHTQQDKYEKSGIYNLKCHDCKKAYVWQTGGAFPVRLREHFWNYKFANNKSKFAEHLLDHSYSCGPMNTTMDILNLTSKVTMMNTLKMFHIYSETKRDNQINDRHTVKSNAIFNFIIRSNSDQDLPTPH